MPAAKLKSLSRKKSSEKAVSHSVAVASSLPDRAAVSRDVPLVFISHDSRDADLAEAFDHLLTDASGGVIQTFRSSDQSGRAGIDYGENWYSAITKSLSDATDVVALLTPNSVGRPWLLFEAGFAIGRLDAKVFGIALGLPLSKAIVGPFAQFQNCEATADSLTTVVLKLIQRNPNARPREQAVRKQVELFLTEIAPLLDQRSGSEEETKDEMEATDVAKMFEEVKVMFRDLSTRVQSGLRDQGAIRKRRRFHPMMIEEIFHLANDEETDPSIAWLMIASVFREELPWLAESSLEIYRAVQGGSPDQILTARQNMNSMLSIMRHSKFFHRFMRDDEETFFLMRHLPDMLEHFSPLPEVEVKKPIRRLKPAISQSATDSPEESKE